MNKIQIFANTFKKAITTPNYYLEFIKAKSSFGYKYLTFLVFLHVLLITIFSTIFLTNLNTKTPEFVESLYSMIKQLYPEDLVVTVEKGEVSTNSNSLTNIKIPENKLYDLFSNELNELEKMELQASLNKYNLLVIDTNGKIENFRSYNTLILVTKNNISYISEADNSGITTFETVEIPKDSKKLIITNSIYQDIVEKINTEFLVKLSSFLKGLIISLALIWPILGTLITTFSYLFLLLIHSLFLKISNALMHKGYSYKELYKIGMLALTIPITLDTLFFVLWYFKIFVNSNIFLLPLIHFIVSTIVLYKLPAKEYKSKVITPEVVTNG